VARKQVFGSEARLAGKGCQTVALCDGVFVFFVFSNRELTPERFSWVAHNGQG